MADLDLEDVDKPIRAPARPSRFAPKGAKLIPKLEPKVESIVSQAAEVKLDDSRLDDVAPMDLDVDATRGAVPKDESMEFKEGEDFAVREIDVYFTRPSDPNSKLYVLQYPLRPVWRPYELDDRCTEVRVKPMGTNMEVDLSVDENPNNYDMDADPELKMKKQTLASAWHLPSSTAYAVGALVGNKFHINPIHAVVQLRPSTKRLVPDKRNRITDSSLEDAVKSEEGTDTKSGGSSKRQEPSKSTAPSKEQNKDTAETWLPLKYHGRESDSSAKCLADMVRQDNSSLQFSMSRSDYVDCLCPVAPNGNKGSKGLWERLNSRVSPTVEQTWQERLKAWLVEGPPIHRFDTLKHLAPDVSVEEFLVELRKHACLVQGLWVPKTPLYYKEDVGERALARDYILMLFNENEIIKNSQLPTTTRMLAAMKGVLEILARERPSLLDWKFREDTDLKFLKEHPHIYEEEQASWKRVKAKTEGMLGSMMKNSLKPATANKPLMTSSKQTSKISSGVNTRMPMPDETREALTHALQKLFHTQKVCSANQIRQRLRDMAVSESFKPKGSKEALIAALGVDNSSKELQAVISDVCVDIHGVYVPRSSPDNPELDEFRKVVIDLFLADGPNAKIKKAAIKEAAKVKLNREIKDQEYLKVVQELCIAQSSAWVLKSGDGNSR